MLLVAMGDITDGVHSPVHVHCCAAAAHSTRKSSWIEVQSEASSNCQSDTLLSEDSQCKASSQSSSACFNGHTEHAVQNADETAQASRHQYDHESSSHTVRTNADQMKSQQEACSGAAADALLVLQQLDSAVLACLPKRLGCSTAIQTVVAAAVDAATVPEMHAQIMADLRCRHAREDQLLTQSLHLCAERYKLPDMTR